MPIDVQKRKFLAAAGTGFIAGAAVTFGGLEIYENVKGKEVTASEDLMREHGILRRALLVYREIAAKLQNDPASVDAKDLYQTAELFRAFGEDYHEKKLEEAYIFPAVRKHGGRAAAYADILQKQHDIGRAITDYILSATKSGSVATADAVSLAGAMMSLDKMYEHHAAREDTIVFPAWKKSLSNGEFKEIGEKFEEIEHQQFGADGFDYAEKTISKIEESLGLANIAQFDPQT